MNKFIILALVVVATSATFLDSYKKQLDSIVMKFPEIKGFENYKGMNVMKCLEDAGNVFHDGVALVEQFEQNAKDINTDIDDLVTLLKGVQAMLPDCGLNLDISPLTSKIFSDFQTGGCIGDIEQLVQTVNKTIQDGKRKDFPSLISDIEAITSQVKQLAADCKVVEANTVKLLTQAVPSGFNAAKCFSHATNIVNDVQRFFTESSTLHRNASHVIDHAFETIRVGLEVFSQECGLGYVESLMNQEAPASCIDDIMMFVKDLKDVIVYIKQNGMSFNAMGKLSGLMNDFNTIKSQCPFVQELAAQTNNTTIATQ